MIPEYIDLNRLSSIEGYKIGKTLGTGGFGTVFLAGCSSTQKNYALKILRMWEIDAPDREKILARFKLEFETGKIGCQNLVHNHHYGFLKGNPYIIMDFCPNGDLRSRMNFKPLNVHEINPIAAAILKGLKSLHENGKVHRDIKPENILFDADNIARLTDFGISGHANLAVRLTKMNLLRKPVEIFGTYMYMPPEQANPKNAYVTILPTIDIFAFGVLMYELFAGKLPFGPLRRNTDLGTYCQNATNGSFENLKKINPSVPDNWNKTIAVCINPDYRKRPQSATEILEMLNLTNSHTILSQNAAQPEPLVELLIMQGEEHGKVFNLCGLLNQKKQGILTLGRNEYDVINDINIKDEQACYVSRRHATIERLPFSPFWVLKDGQWRPDCKRWKKSTNGTFINSSPVDHEIGITLLPDSIITIGDTTLKVIKSNTFN
jgi:serine/threonine protein kinase